MTVPVMKNVQANAYLVWLIKTIKASRLQHLAFSVYSVDKISLKVFNQSPSIFDGTFWLTPEKYG